jgi:hypothetical protein
LLHSHFATRNISWRGQNNAPRNVDRSIFNRLAGLFLVIAGLGFVWPLWSRGSIAMQKSSYDLSADERRVVRKWRIAVVGFYGSLLVILALLAFAGDKDFLVARTDLPAALQNK